MTVVILSDVKTAISLPDELFLRAEELAQRLGIPRSQLYARALSEFLDAHGPAQVTAALNAVYRDSPSVMDADLVVAQEAAVGKQEW